MSVVKDNVKLFLCCRVGEMLHEQSAMTVYAGDFCPLRIRAQARVEGGLRTRGLSKIQQSQQKPLVTIITAVYNAVSCLESCIVSVLNQSYDNIEFIIVDGGSTDGSVDIIRKYDEFVDYWISEPDNGIYDAWNKGVSLAKGSWIAFLGADDVYLEDAVERYVKLFNSDPSSEFISSRVKLVAAGKPVRIIGQSWQWNLFRKHMTVVHVGSFHSRTLFEKYGLFDTSYRICGDYEFLLRAGRQLRTLFLSEVTALMGAEGVSNLNFKVFEEALRAKMTTGRRAPILCHIDNLNATLRWMSRRLLLKLK